MIKSIVAGATIAASAGFLSASAFANISYEYNYPDAANTPEGENETDSDLEEIFSSAPANYEREPKESRFVSDSGVDFRDGSFHYSTTDLSIGGGDFPIGLELRRSYSSSSPYDFSGFGSLGWTHNFSARFSQRIIEERFEDRPPGQERWLYSVSIGPWSASFTGGSSNPTGGLVGEYNQILHNSEHLEYVGTQEIGTMIFTASDGTEIIFSKNGVVFRPELWTAPDGTRLDYLYNTQGILSSLVSSRGYAIIFERQDGFSNLPVTRACIINMAHTFVGNFNQCPAGSTSSAYNYSPSIHHSSMRNMASQTSPTGGITNYSYVGADKLGCIRYPNEQTCHVSNSYNVCKRLLTEGWDPAGLRLMDSVIHQAFPDGSSKSYSFEQNPFCPQVPTLDSITVTENSGGRLLAVTTNQAGQATKIVDPLGRVRQFNFVRSPFYPERPGRLISFIEPEENSGTFSYDARGNQRVARLISKPGQNATDIVRSAQYPTGCEHRKTCNKPLSMTDANGNVTNFTYAAEHGGVLTETGPPVNGVRPQTRYEYAQRHAWISNGAGGHVPASHPVWVLTATSMCRTSAATGNPAAPCAAAGDEVRTTFDYGPDSGPNNLLLRGQVVHADGQSLRTCYGYDASGNRVSETSPRAGLASCS